jgi:hypothetical protein
MDPRTAAVAATHSLVHHAVFISFTIPTAAQEFDKKNICRYTAKSTPLIMAEKG